MNEFETLDEDLSEEGISQNMKSLGATIGQWAKIVAIVGIVAQAIDFFVKIITTGGQNIAGALIGAGIVVGLYMSLFKFGQAMVTFSEAGTFPTFAEAMSRQRIYWQFLGVLCIIILTLLLIVMAAFGDEILSYLGLFMM